MATSAFASHGDILASRGGCRFVFDATTPSRLPSPAKRNEFEPSDTGRSELRLQEPRMSARPVSAAPVSDATVTAPMTTSTTSARRPRWPRWRRRRARRRARRAASWESSCTSTSFSHASVVQKLAQENPENGDRDGDEEVRTADRGQERAERLRPSLPDLACQPGTEHVVVEIRARDQHTDERALDGKHPVEPRGGRVEGVRTHGEDRAGADRAAERAPADRPPAPSELAEQPAAVFSLEALHRRHGDEDERD